MSATAVMPNIELALVNFLRRSLAFVKEGATNPTFVNDLRKLQSAEFRDAMNLHQGSLSEDDEGEDAVSEHRLIQDLLDLLDTMGNTGIDGLNSFLSRHIPKAKAAAEWHKLDHKRPPAYLWGPMVYSTVLFHFSTVVGGKDAGFTLASAPAVQRAMTIYFDRGTHPTASWWGTYELVEQRFIRLLPSLAVYAATINPENRGFYGNKLYYGLSIGLSVPVVLMSIIRRKRGQFRDDRDIKWAIKTLKVMEDAGEENLPRIAAELNTNATALGNWIKHARILRKKFKTCYGTANAYSYMMAELNRMLRGILTVARGEVLRPENPNADEKWGAVVLASLVVGMSAACTNGDAAALIGVGIWGIWLVDLMVHYAREEDRSKSDILNFLSQAGISLVFTIFAVYIPLAVAVDVFETHEWPFWISLILQVVLNGLYGHLIGPYLNENFIMPVMPFFGKYGIRPVRYCCVKAGGGLSKTKTVLMRRLKPRTDEENAAGDVVLQVATEEEIQAAVLSPEEAAQAAALGRALKTPDPVHLRGGGEKDVFPETTTTDDLLEDFFMQGADLCSWQDPVVDDEVTHSGGDDDEVTLFGDDDAEEDEGTSNPLNRAFHGLAGYQPNSAGNDDEENSSAGWADLMSALDITEDTGELPKQEGGEEFDRVRSFVKTMFSGKQGSAMLKTVGFLFSGPAA